MIDRELRKKHWKSLQTMKDLKFQDNRAYRKVEKCLEKIYDQLKNYEDRSDGKVLMARYIHSDIHNSSIGTTLSQLESCGVLKERSSSSPKSYEPSVHVEKLQVVADCIYGNHPDPEVQQRGFGVEG
ncbi:hypothetical protein [Candidatus Nanohalococcus occultus]|uniref:hypothetical protein n=1 Tax=Candidatus Nanohalococcus occultus TaxID=2978047 RepID=UPI0039E09D7B